MTYFKNCTSIEEVKKLYRTLAIANHPDKGGNLEVMQAINAEYALICALIASGKFQPKNEEKYTNQETNDIILESEKFQKCLNIIIGLANLEIELIGSWLWVSKSLYVQKDILVSAGLRWCKVKKMWYLHSGEFRKRKGGNMDIEEIRMTYGTQKVTNFNRHYSLA